MVASILLRLQRAADLRIGDGQITVAKKRDRLKEIQDQLDLLMDELHRLRHEIDDQSTKRRTYPFPFERAVAHDVGSKKSEFEDS